MKRKNFLASVLALPFVGALVPKPKIDNTRKVWKPEDLSAGLYITRCTGEGRDAGYRATVSYQIGWNHFIRNSFPPKDKYDVEKYTLHSLADGWDSGDWNHSQSGKIRGFTHRSLAEYMNNDSFGYRPLTQEEMIEIIKYSKKNFLCTT